MEIVDELNNYQIVNKEKNEIWMVYTHNSERTIDFIIHILNKKCFDEIYIYDLMDISGLHNDYKTAYSIYKTIKTISLNSFIVVNIKYLKNYQILKRICKVASKRNLRMVIIFDVNSYNDKNIDSLKKYQIKLFTDERNEENEC